MWCSREGSEGRACRSKSQPMRGKCGNRGNCPRTQEQATGFRQWRQPNERRCIELRKSPHRKTASQRRRPHQRMSKTLRTCFGWQSRVFQRRNRRRSKWRFLRCRVGNGSSKTLTRKCGTPGRPNHHQHPQPTPPCFHKRRFRSQSHCSSRHSNGHRNPTGFHFQVWN